MPTLIVHSGSTKRLFPSEPQPFLVYRIGAGDSAFPNSINVNDAGRLNNIAEKLRDNYSTTESRSVSVIFLPNGLMTYSIPASPSN